MSHHQDCPAALFFTDHPELCRCVFTAPSPDDLGTESPIHDELALETFREQLRKGWPEIDA